MLLSKNAKRLAIFAFYDAQGIVDDYVLYLLQTMRAFCAEQIMVINGTLTPESEGKVKAHCTKLIYRANSGYDITGYKETFLQLENIGAYDEILFYNQTVFGPVCPLETMFHTMALRDVDFWGLTRHKGAKTASWDSNAAIPPHVQSYFFAVRRSMFATDAFAEYWKNLPKIETYWDAVGKHEVVFTQHFSALGFAWDTYMHTEDLEPYNDYPLMGMPTELLQRGCPFVKRKNFLCDRHSYSTVPQGAAPNMLLEYLREKTIYPIALIMQNLLRTVDISTLQNAIAPLYDVRGLKGKTGKTAAVLWFAQEELGNLLCAAANAAHRDATMYYLFATPALRDTFLPRLPKNASAIITDENGAVHLFGSLWREVSAHDYILYLNNALPLLLKEFYDVTSLQSAVQNLTQTGCAVLLEQHAELGVLTAPTPMHQDCLSLGKNWPEVAARWKSALREAGITVPLGENAPGRAVRGGMFFARTSAVEPLTRFTFAPEQFEGPYPAWEFFVPLAAQQAGYLTGISCVAQEAFAALENRADLLNQITDKWGTKNMVRADQILFRMQAILDFYYERRYQMTLEQAFAQKLTAKQKLWICLQIILKPETFAKLHKNKPALQLPPDELE